MRDRLPVPARIQNAPELLFGLEVYYLAFLDLSTCRQIGTTEGPISWMVIEQYAVSKRFEGEQKEDLFYHVAALDSAYFEHKASKVAAKTKAPVGGTKRKK